jgi:hypothetical protein
MSADLSSALRSNLLRVQDAKNPNLLQLVPPSNTVLKNELPDVIAKLSDTDTVNVEGHELDKASLQQTLVEAQAKHGKGMLDTFNDTQGGTAQKAINAVYAGVDKSMSHVGETLTKVGAHGAGQMFMKNPRTMGTAVLATSTYLTGAYRVITNSQQGPRPL